MIIVEDTRQQAGQHEIKHAAWQAHGDDIVRCALPAGDYALPPKVAIDTKANMAEIAENIGGAKREHERFRRELIRAKDMGTHLYILIENEDGIRTIEDVRSWRNPRLDYSDRAITGERLARAMRTMQERYGCTFLFCEPQRAAAYIFKILERGI